MALLRAAPQWPSSNGLVAVARRFYALAMKENLVVSVRQGKLRGVEVDNVEGGKYLAFRGIPYAKAPIGRLRFKDPLPPETWTGIRNAKEFGDECPQLDFINHEFIGSEDCLYLNVYTTTTESKRRLPVMVWVHGGAFLLGSGDDAIYGADYLVKKDVVLVTINYRLGALGFLSLEDEIAPGNQGLKDQLMALRWVRENIENFGGDPGNVTLFGESAGAVGVHMMAVSPLATGLFHKIILQSGSLLNPWAVTPYKPRSLALRLSRHLGNHSTDSKRVFEFLQEVDVKKLIMAQRKILIEEGSQEFIIKSAIFAPTPDPKSSMPIIPDPYQLARRGIKVPFLSGHNANEGLFFLRKQSPRFYKAINTDFGSILPERILELLKEEGITPEHVKRHYFGRKEITTKDSAAYGDMLGDMLIERGMYDAVDVQINNKHDQTYFYKFTYDGKMSLLKYAYEIEEPGATHGDEMSYLFRQKISESLELNKIKPNTPQYKIMQYFTQMWTDFARTGNPTPRKTTLIPVQWEPVRSKEVYNYLNIDEQLTMKSVRRNDQRFEWKKMQHKL